MNVGSERNEKIFTFNLHAVTGVIKQADPPPLTHFLLVKVFSQGVAEVPIFQGGSHVCGISQLIFSRIPVSGARIICVRERLPPTHREWSGAASILKMNFDFKPFMAEKF